MSWEYSFNLDSEESVSLVVMDLKNCELFSSSTTDYIDWKNPESMDDIPYDARFYTDKKKKLSAYNRQNEMSKIAKRNVQKILT